MSFFSISFLILFFFPASAFAESLSYSGRLVNANGSPVTGPVNLRFELSYTNAPTTILCTQNVNGVALTNGVFHTKIDFTTVECGGDELSEVLLGAVAGESTAIRVTDLTNAKAYSFQALHSMPQAVIAKTAKSLTQNGAATNDYLKWNGTSWVPAAIAAGTSGTVTSVATGTGLTGGPITATGTISVASGGITSTLIADDSIVNADINSAAAIARSKLANGTANYVVINGAGGALSEVAQLPIAQGGTNATTAAGARTNLGLGTAAVANIGQVLGNVMGADAVPNCGSTQKLQMSLGPTYAWTCVGDYAADATKLPLAGGTMTGAIDMGSTKITSLATPTNPADATTKAYVDTAAAAASHWTLASGNIHRASGNVGVGNTSPQRLLHVSGPIRMEASALPGTPAAGDMAIDSADGFKLKWYNGTAWQTASTGAGAGDFMKDGSVSMTGNIRLNGNYLSNDGGSEGILVDNSGNVGIGVPSPTSLFQTASSAAKTASYIAVQHSATNTSSTAAIEKVGVDIQSTGVWNGAGSVNTGLNVGVSGGTINYAALFNGGNVGIGTLSPDRLLHVTGPIRVAATALPSTPIAGDIAIDSADANKLKWHNGTAWQTVGAAGSGVTSIIGGTGLTGGTITSSGTLAVDVGVAANKIVQLDGSAKLPAVDGSALTNIAAGNIAGTVPVANGGTGSTTAAGARTNLGLGTAAVANIGQILGNVMGADAVPNCGSTQKLQMSLGPTFAWTCVTDYSTDATKLPLAGGTMSGAIDMGSTKITSLATPTNPADATTKAYVDSTALSSNHWTLGSGNVYRTTGSVGVGTNSPSRLLHVTGPIRMEASALPASPVAGDLAVDSADGNKFKWHNGTAWQSVVSGTAVTSVIGGTGLTGGTITSTGTLAVDVGVTANKIVQLDGSAKLPAVDGSALTNIAAANITGTLPVANGGTGSTTAAGARTNLGLGTAAVANIGQVLGNVMAADIVPNCGSTQKLQMSLGPTFAWTCVTDYSTDATKLPLAGGTMTGAIDMGSTKITSVATPTDPTDAATKSYVDATAVSSNYWTLASGNLYRTSGNIGLGTSSPTSMLHTSESAAKTASYVGIQHTIGSTSSTASINKTGMDIQSTGTWNGTTAVNTALNVNATGGTTNYAAIFSGGNVGIGTTTPGSKLDVSGTFAVSGNSTLSGSVGIGTGPASDARLYINSNPWNQTSGEYSGFRNYVVYNGTSNNSGTIYGNYINMLSTRTGTNGTLTGQRIYMDVESGIGATTNIKGVDSYLNIKANSNVTLALGVYGGVGYSGSATVAEARGLIGAVGGSGTITNGYAAYLENVTATNAYGLYQVGTTNKNYFGGSVGIGTTTTTHKLTVAGTIGASVTNTYDLGTSAILFKDAFVTNGVTTTSDVRKKKDIKDSDLGLDFVIKLRPVSYYWKEGDKHLHYGLIAQETEQVINQAKTKKVDNVIVTHDKKTDAYGVRYTELLAPVIKAIQELYAKMVSHDQRLAKLETQERSIASLKVEASTAKLQAENEKLKQENTAIKAYLCGKDAKAPFCQLAP